MAEHGIKLIQEQYNYCPVSVVTGSGGLGTSRPLCPSVYKHSSTPPIKYLAGTVVELRFLVAGVSQAGSR